MILTFFLAVIGWVIFRASGIPTVLGFFKGLFHFETLSAFYKFITLSDMWPTNVFIIVMLLVEWLHRSKDHGFEISYFKPFIRYATVILLIEIILFFMPTTPSQFIYFQF